MLRDNRYSKNGYKKGNIPDPGFLGAGQNGRRARGDSEKEVVGLKDCPFEKSTEEVLGGPWWPIGGREGPGFT